MSTINYLSSINEMQQYLQDEHISNLHEQAFLETLNVLVQFKEEGMQIRKRKRNSLNDDHEENEDYLSWVCNSRPGFGKTTALKVMLKMAIKEKQTAPFLLVFNNKDTMGNVYDELSEYGREMGRDIIQYVDESNAKGVQEILHEYPFICITQQRFRDIALGQGNWGNYSTYTPTASGIIPKGQRQWLKRLIIVDEKPIFHDECVFDISSSNNAVDWFVNLADDSDLTKEEKQTGRSLIMLMINYELFNNIHTTTRKLMRIHEGSILEEQINYILSKLPSDNGELGARMKYKWFMKLLKNDGVGYIDNSNGKSSILCAERIDYRKLGNILILDGTSDYTKLQYNNEYEFIRVNNYHDYKSRLFIHWRKINTSSSVRSKKEKSVQKAISLDISSIRNELGINLFPLVAKSDIEEYKKNGVITQEQQQYYQPKQSEEDDMPLNLLNTTGKEVLSKYDALALTNLPIKHPQHYKAIAIALYGVDIDCSMAEKNEGKWFKDERLQQLFEEDMLADLLQIIHRSNLRKVTKKNKINIFMYHNRREWIWKLKDVFNLTDENIKEKGINNESLYHFKDKCIERAEKASKYCLEMTTRFNHSFSAFKIGERSFKSWLNENWKKEERKNNIVRVFKDYGIEVIEDKNGYKEICLIDNEELF